MEIIIIIWILKEHERRCRSISGLRMSKLSRCAPSKQIPSDLHLLGKGNIRNIVFGENINTGWTYSLGSLFVEDVAYKKKLQNAWSWNVNALIVKRPMDLWQQNRQSLKINLFYWSILELSSNIKPYISIWEDNEPLWLTCIDDRLHSWIRRNIYLSCSVNVKYLTKCHAPLWSFSIWPKFYFKTIYQRYFQELKKNILFNS